MDYQNFPYEPEVLAGTLGELLALRGETREVAIVTFSKIEPEFYTYDNWDGGIWKWDLTFRTAAPLYAQFSREEIREAEESLRLSLNEVFPDPKLEFNAVRVASALNPHPDWRERNIAWLRGEGINNQGRVRSDNVAPRQEDGLLFRSTPEIHLYRALKDRGVTFAPLPVFLRGGASYQRIEPDFVLFKKNVLMIVEVDGDTVHRETPAEADQRIRMFKYEGAHVERVTASTCDTPEKAKACADVLLKVLENYATVR